MREKITKYLYLPWALPLLVFISFLIANWCIYGPAYLSDEVGYLNKAATVAGQTVDISSSWFGGYSILISPAFFISHNPYIEWRIVLVLNAMMWAVTAALLRYVLKSLRPQASEKQLAIASAGAMLYPAWITMSGYAFATTGFVFVFMISLALMIKSGLNRPGWLLLSALTAGYAYWIHPFGIAYVSLFVLFMCLLAVIRKQWHFLAAGIIASGIAILYSIAVAPFFNTLMSSDTVNNYHYSSSIHNLTSTLSDPGFPQRFFLLLIGLSFSAIVSTLGIVVFAVYGHLQLWKKDHLNLKEKFSKTELIIPAFLIVLVVAVVCLNTLASVGNTTLRVDEWIYGRYVDMFLLPLLGLGLLYAWRKKVIIITALYAATGGLILWLGTNSSNTHFDLINKGNIQGFWPVVAAHFLPISDYLVWGLLGAVGVLLCLLASSDRTRRYLLLLLLPILIADAGNIDYHRKILVTHSTVTSLYSYLQTHYTRNQCIGFPLEADLQERFSLYSYYLHGYDIEQMSLQQWLAKGCTGPYFTYNKQVIALYPDLHVTGIETKTELLMITKNSAQPPIISFD